MSFHLPSRSRQRFPKEEELIQAEARLRGATAPVQLQVHPSRSQLTTFAAGQYTEDDPKINAIWDHLHHCNTCLAALAEIRRTAGSEGRTSILGARGLILAAVAVVVLAAICFWAIRARTPSTTIAMIDLREVTRGSGASAIVVHRDSRAIHVLLPVDSPSGYYEVGIFGSAALPGPILKDSARSTIENGDVVVAVSIPFKQLRPGAYLLGLRYGSSDWKHYEITIK